MNNLKWTAAVLGLLAGASAGSAGATTQTFPTYAPLYSLDGTTGGNAGGGSARFFTLAGPSKFNNNDVTVSGDGTGAVSSFSSYVNIYAHTNNATQTKTLGSATPAGVSSLTKLGVSDSSSLAFAYVTDFKLGPNYTNWNGLGTSTMSNSSLSLTMTQTSTGGSYLTGTDFLFEDLGTTGSATPTILGTATVGTNHTLTLLANFNPNNTNHTYAIVVTVPKSVITSSSNTFTVSGSVPLPGAVVPFGAFLLGLVGLRYAYTRRQAGC